MRTAASGSPDIYNNDTYGLSRAMVDGLLWNVKNPGDDVKNYFEFEREGRYHEFIKGCTFDQEKLYLFAGDYFIDMIRMAWIVLVNNDLLENNLGKMPDWCTSVKEFYDFVADGLWDLDMLAEMSGLIFTDGSDGKGGVTEKTDKLVGFAISRLGEMESSALREFSAVKGLVPVPKWNYEEQEEYHTVIHDQAEIGCILNTARAFSAASALMEYLNEESEQVVYAYYEKGLKYKYNDDENARAMMDLVRETTDSPFNWQIGILCNDLYRGSGSLTGLKLIDNKTIGSTFASEKDAYNDCMAKMIEKFKNLK